MQQPSRGKSNQKLYTGLRVVQVSAEEWKIRFSENFHKLVFKEYKPAVVDRISYALLFIQDEKAVGYVTVRENDFETVYWQFGGVLARFRRGVLGVRCIEVALEWQKARSKRVLIYVDNRNTPMLKLALAKGFLIVGTKACSDGAVLVDMVKEFEHLGTDRVSGKEADQQS